MRVPNVSRKLTLDDAIEIWRRRAAGEAYNRLAARFGVNQGRIADVLKERLFPEAEGLAGIRDNLLCMPQPGFQFHEERQ